MRFILSVEIEFDANNEDDADNFCEQIQSDIEDIGEDRSVETIRTVSDPYLVPDIPASM